MILMLHVQQNPTLYKIHRHWKTPVELFIFHTLPRPWKQQVISLKFHRLSKTGEPASLGTVPYNTLLVVGSTAFCTISLPVTCLKSIFVKYSDWGKSGKTRNDLSPHPPHLPIPKSSCF